MDVRGIVVRFRAVERDFGVPQSVYTGSDTVLGHLSCAGVKRSGREADEILLRGLRIRGAIPPFPHTSL